MSGGGEVDAHGRRTWWTTPSIVLLVCVVCLSLFFHYSKRDGVCCHPSQLNVADSYRRHTGKLGCVSDERRAWATHLIFGLKWVVGALLEVRQ